MSEAEKVCVRILMNVINYAASQLTNFDDDFKKKVSALNETIQWKVEDIAFSTEIKNGKITGSEGTVSNPGITFDLANVGLALELLTGKVEMLKVVDKIKISGDAQKIQELNFILDTIREYIGDITG